MDDKLSGSNATLFDMWSSLGEGLSVETSMSSLMLSLLRLVIKFCPPIRLILWTEVKYETGNMTVKNTQLASRCQLRRRKVPQEAALI